MRGRFSEYVRKESMEKAPISTSSKHYNKKFYNPEYHESLMADGPELVQLSHNKNPPTRLNFSEAWDSLYQVVPVRPLSLCTPNCSGQCFCAAFSTPSSPSGPSTIPTRRTPSAPPSEASTPCVGTPLARRGNTRITQVHSLQAVHGCMPRQGHHHRKRAPP